MMQYLNFEKTIADLAAKIEELRHLSSNPSTKTRTTHQKFIFQTKPMGKSPSSAPSSTSKIL
jgi:acetyl-CoA carboxylase alpha subunit